MRKVDQRSEVDIAEERIEAEDELKQTEGALLLYKHELQQEEQRVLLKVRPGDRF